MPRIAPLHKQRDLPKEEDRAQFPLFISFFAPCLLRRKNSSTSPFVSSDLNKLMRNLTLTAEENYPLQDGLCLCHFPSSHFRSTSWSALGPPLEPLWLLPFSSFSVSLPLPCPSCCLLFFTLTILLIIFPIPCRSLHLLFFFSPDPFSLCLDSLLMKKMKSCKGEYSLCSYFDSEEVEHCLHQAPRFTVEAESTLPVWFDTIQTEKISCVQCRLSRTNLSSSFCWTKKVILSSKR